MQRVIYFSSLAILGLMTVVFSGSRSWSQPLAPSGQAAGSPQGPLSMSYDMPRDAELSMGIFDKDGHLLRMVAKSDFRQAGKNTEYWDGRDQYGKPIPAGEYVVKALYHDPISTEYVMTLCNPGNPPWPTPDGKGDWLSDEATPQAAVTDGKWVYLAAPGAEYGWSVIAVDEKGQRQWGVNVMMWPVCVSVALQGDNLYVLFSGGAEGRRDGMQRQAVLMCLDKRTGAAERFTKIDPKHKIAVTPYNETGSSMRDLRAKHAYEPGVYAGQPRYFCNDAARTAGVLGLAATTDTIYASEYFGNQLLAIDAVNGTLQPEKNISIQKPVGLYGLSDEALLAVSDGKVVKVNLKTRAVTPVVTTNLVAPHSLTVDKGGNIYVSDWKDSFQVKVFSAEGKFLRAIGKPGGRPWVGKWERDGMLVPRGLAVTDEGKLWVAEDDECPKRVSVWDAASGAFIRDYIGPTPYGGGGMFWIDPQDPTIAHAEGTRFKVDWQKKTYTPLAVEFRLLSPEQPYMPNGHDIFGNGVKVLQHGGKQYVALAAGGYDYRVFMRKDHVLVPVAAFGAVRGRAEHAGNNYSWSDCNGDGLVQADEMSWVKNLSRGEAYVAGRQPEFFSSWGMSMGPDWSLYFGGFCRNTSVIMRLRPTGWTGGDVPLYDISKAEAIVTQRLGFDGLYVNDEGRVFGTGMDLGYNMTQNKFPPPADRPDALSCFDGSGKKLWSIVCPDEPRVKDVMASNAIGEFTIPGIGNVVCTWQWWGNCRPYFVSSDGLYVGTALDDGKSGPAGLWSESYNHFYQAPDGTPYVINGGNDGHHILRLRGLEKSGRFDFKLTLSEADARVALAATTAPAASAAIPRPVLCVRWLDKAPVIDGNLDDWDPGYAATIDSGDGFTATASLGRDADKLYLAYHVNDDTPLLNKGKDWQTLFVTGDCVDLMLCTDPKTDPNRRSAAVGDLRLLLSCFQDEPVAVLYRPVTPAPDAKPVTLMYARVDQIQRLTDAKVAFRRGNGFYEIEAAVPLKTLGLPPGWTSALRGDVGVIYSDTTGNDRVKRVYFYNQRTKMVSDLTTEATLQPAEWGTVSLPMAANRIKDGGFEGTFAKSPEDGWFVAESQNGCVAELAPEGAHSGKNALHLQQTAAAGGKKVKGSGSVTVVQQVSVTGGRKYSLRFFYRTEGLRALALARPQASSRALRASVHWIGKDLKSPGDIASGMVSYTGWGDPGSTPVMDIRAGTEGWVESYDQRVPDYFAPRPYPAPPGATAARISFTLTGATPDDPATAVIDDVEFVEEPGN